MQLFLNLFISKDALHVSSRSSAHHQEHTTVQTASGIVNQLVDPAQPRPTALLSPSSDGKPEAATAVVDLMMMGMRMPETC
jgi:hypothetical protein